MNTRLGTNFDTHFNARKETCLDGEVRLGGSALFGRAQLGSLPVAASARVVNRTHRVVRERAIAIEARRSQARSLMVPLLVCSVLLMLTAIAVWSGLYQYQAVAAAVAVQADVAALAAGDATDHLLVVLLWFVPVSIALLGAILFRRTRSNTGRETVR